MADLQTVLSEAIKLNRNIEQFLKFSTYTDYDDLSGLDIDFTDGEQLSFWTSCGASRNGWQIFRITFPI